MRETIKEKLYPAKHWGYDAFWRVELECDYESGEFYLSIGVVRCNENNTIIGYLPFGRLARFDRDKVNVVDLMRKRQSLQSSLIERMGHMSWDYDREALEREYRWDTELSKGHRLAATDPNWSEIEPYFQEWFIRSPWKEDETLEFEGWMESMMRDPEFERYMDEMYRYDDYE